MGLLLVVIRCYIARGWIGVGKGFEFWGWHGMAWMEHWERFYLEVCISI